MDRPRSNSGIKFLPINRLKITSALFAGVIFLSGPIGCATLKPRSALSDTIAANQALQKEIIQTSYFHLTSFSRITDTSKPLSVYIEGDGLSWYSRTELSADPTPSKPVALELATQDPGPNVVYLARPCQHTSLKLDELCKDPSYWSNKRFSEEVVTSVNEAVSAFVSKGRFPEITLTGFSGGGAVAALVAARRSDVTRLQTVAGNLDSRGLSEYHGVSYLSGSLEPIDCAAALAHIPQVHWVGERDKIIPRQLASNFKEASGSPPCLAIVMVPGASHLEGWHNRWRELLERYPNGNCV